MAPLSSDTVEVEDNASQKSDSTDELQRDPKPLNGDRDEDESDDNSEVESEAAAESASDASTDADTPSSLSKSTSISYDWSALPGEVRNKIYRYLMRSHKQIDFEYADFRLPKTLSSDFHLSAQLLRCSKQVRAECQPILYGENVFRIHNNLNDVLGGRKKGLVRKIAIATRTADKVLNKTRVSQLKGLKNLTELIVDAEKFKGRLLGLEEQDQVDKLRETWLETHQSVRNLVRDWAEVQSVYLITGQVHRAQGVSSLLLGVDVAKKDTQPDDVNLQAEFKFKILVNSEEGGFDLDLVSRRVYEVAKGGLRIYR